MKSDSKMAVGGVYLCLYDQGTLKVGHGKDVHVRLSVHRATGVIFGANVVKINIFECENHAVIERKLIEWCKKNSVSARSNEWFQGIDYEKCLEQVDILLKAPKEERKKTRSADEVLAYMEAHFNGYPLPFVLGCNLYK